MYLRETRRANKDGSVVRYLQLAHNVRHPVTGVRLFVLPVGAGRHAGVR